MGLKNPKLKIDWIRVEGGYHGLHEVCHDTNTGMISFSGKRHERLDVYTTTGTTVLKPKQGKFKVVKDNSFEGVIEIMSGLSKH